MVKVNFGSRNKSKLINADLERFKLAEDIFSELGQKIKAKDLLVKKEFDELIPTVRAATYIQQKKRL